MHCMQHARVSENTEETTTTFPWHDKQCHDARAVQDLDTTANPPDTTATPPDATVIHPSPRAMKVTEASVITQGVTVIQDSKSNKLILTVRRITTMELTREAIGINQDTPARAVEGIQDTSDDNVGNVDMIFSCCWASVNNISLVRMYGMGVEELEPYTLHIKFEFWVHTRPSNKHRTPLLII